MKIVVFGLTISSSWGNGHATLWRGLCRGLAVLGHSVTFFEKDVPYYARQRDCVTPEGCELHLYEDWDSAYELAQSALDDADAALVTSYCPDARQASELVLSQPSVHRVYYDLDAPVTLSQIRAGIDVPYIPEEGLGRFDLVLSFAGGPTLRALEKQLGARRTAALYGSVDPDVHRPSPSIEAYQGELSYLGTYAMDRQQALETLFVEPAKRLSHQRFVLAGAQYPKGFPGLSNIQYFEHLAPAQHPGFYCSSPFTLNLTRAAMAQMGYCPSGRLFEAACCGVAMISDEWDGIDEFFEPGKEIILVRSTEQVLGALAMPIEKRAELAAAGRMRVLKEHTAKHRAEELVELLQAGRKPESYTVSKRAVTYAI